MKNDVVRGFTLLEVLVVIAIIGILISMGTAAYTSAQKKSRDSRRSADLKAIQNAFEQYYADNGRYPTSASCTVGTTMVQRIAVVRSLREQPPAEMRRMRVVHSELEHIFA